VKKGIQKGRKPPLGILAAPSIFYGLVAITCLFLYGYREQGTLSVSLVGLLILGFLLWTLIEYLFHRYLLHWKNQPQFLQNWHHHIHHHGEPEDLEEIIFPIAYSLPVVVLIFLGLWIWIPSLTWAIFPGVLMGYLAYEWLHFGAHFWQPQSRFWNRLLATIFKILKKTMAFHPLFGIIYLELIEGGQNSRGARFR